MAGKEAPAVVSDLLPVIEEAAAIARKLQGRVVPREKPGLSAPDRAISAADIATQELIVAHLSRHYPRWKVISEEMPRPEFTPQEKLDHKFLIDPLDGSFLYLRGSPYYGVQVGLVKSGVYIGSVAALPALNIMCSWPPAKITATSHYEVPSASIFCSVDTPRSVRKALVAEGGELVEACGLLCAIAPSIWPTTFGYCNRTLSERGKIALSLALGLGLSCRDLDSAIFQPVTEDTIVHELITFHPANEGSAQAAVRAAKRIQKSKQGGI